MVDIPNNDVAVVGDAARVAGDFRALGSDVSVLAGDLGGFLDLLGKVDLVLEVGGVDLRTVLLGHYPLKAYTFIGHHHANIFWQCIGFVSRRYFVNAVY